MSNRILPVPARADDACDSVKRVAHSYTFAWAHAIRCVDGVLDGGADPATGGLVVGV